MVSKLNLTPQRAIEDVLQGNLGLEQARKLIEDWPAHTQRELREKSDALLMLSVLSRSKDTTA